ncbi:WhiB family transcriptional regulator [Streptomyces rochei]|uniref:WhiB family transcriptional regulator n=1 Tax=Streptomyces rochei TaxID=1928 RepID=UPI0036FE7EAE
MITYTGGTPRAEDWRDSSACLDHDPELFFPNGTEGGWKTTTHDAKAICARCPVASDCLTFALNEGIQYGIYGGLTDNERRKLQRRATAQITDADVDEVRRPATLEEAFARHATVHGDGHLLWTGPKQLFFAGVYYTPRRTAYLVGHDRPAFGQVHPTCGVAECVQPGHLDDAKDRDARKRAAKQAAEQRAAAERAAGRHEAAAKREPARCGTNSGYRRHVRERTEICAPCRRAHADADARLRRTGTSASAA